MRRTIDNVIDEIEPWQSKYGDFLYPVTAFTTTKEVISANKKDLEKAKELQELLIQAIGQEQEFILEDNGKSQNAGVQKWKLVAFGPPEGVWTYSTIKGGQPEVGAVGEGTGNGATGAGTGGGGTRVAPAPTNNVDASIRAAVALEAATEFASGLALTVTLDNVTMFADYFYEYLERKASGGTALPETDEGVGGGEAPAPSSTN